MSKQNSPSTVTFILLAFMLLLVVACTRSPGIAIPTTASSPTSSRPAATASAGEAVTTPQTAAEPTIQPTRQLDNTPTVPAASPTAASAPTATVMPTPEPPQDSASSPAIPPTGEGVTVAYVQEGEMNVWDEATGQSETIFSEGGVDTLLMSDDSQLIAFVRSWVDSNECNQVALWAVGPNGEDPRELVSPAALRQQLGFGGRWEPPLCTFTLHGTFQIEWLPHTHRLLYSLYAGDEHVMPAGVYAVDADTRAVTVLAPAENSLHFVPSPDGRQIALLSTTGLSFINADGSDWRPDVLTYPATGVPIPLLPGGVWTQDARHFLLVGPGESADPFVLNYTIWRVHVDGSPVQPLATITDTHGGSVTFSPDGTRAAFLSSASVDWESWSITPIAAGVGPLAIPYTIEPPYNGNLHWSPAGTAFVFPETEPGTLVPLCPDATQVSEVCGDPIYLGESVAALRWIDSTRFVFLTRDLATFEPDRWFLGQLDGVTIPIATGVGNWPWNVTTVSVACRDDSEFVLDVNVPDGTHFAPGTSFTKTWRIRNSGTCTWDASYHLNFISGERMNGAERVPLGATVLPGGEIDLSVDLVAPQAAGTYQGQWQLTAADGTPFGAKPYVKIVIP